MRDADGEIGSVDFLPKRRRIVGGALDGDGRVVLAMAKSPLTLTCCPQAAQISSAASAAGAQTQKHASDARDASANDMGKLRKAGNLVRTDLRTGN